VTAVPAPLAQYRALLTKVDAFWERALAVQPAAFRCAAGCVSCCTQRLSVFAVEAEAIRAHLAGPAFDPVVRDRLRAEAAEPGRCAFLTDGRCAIYPARPVICRTHGLPIRPSRVYGRVDWCPLNFTGAPPDPTIVLDLELINTLLTLVDRLHGTPGDPPDRPRVTLADLASSPT
jgi:hypothetical protein